MIKKIQSIVNVGRFLNCRVRGDVQLKKYSMLFAENGRGKTTLCAILRSLQSGIPDHISGRKTLGSANQPEVRIELESGIAVFSSGSWDTTLANLDIFDSTFIAENVYSGDAVSLDQRRNLYRTIIGQEGVRFANRIKELDEMSRAKSSEIREKEAAVSAVVPDGISIENFLAIKEDQEIEQKIEEKNKQLEAIRETQSINERPALAEISLPELPSHFESTLELTVDTIAADVSRRLAEHLEFHAMQQNGEEWISQGLEFIKDNQCPFCAQSLESSSIVEVFRSYFSDAYRELIDQIESIKQEVEARFGDRNLGSIERTIEQNEASLDFWSRYCELPSLPSLDSQSIADQLRSIRQIMLELLRRKKSSPLESIQPDQVYTDLNANLISSRGTTVSYNQVLLQINAAIEAKKQQTSTADIDTVRRELAILEAVKLRHQDRTKELCTSLFESKDQKRAIETEKESIKEALDQHTQDVIARYEQQINSYLKDFNAGFTISGTTTSYAGGNPSASYQIVINEEAVDIGTPDSELDRPSFKNTLSSGDRSTLALAFFLSQLDQKPNKDEIIVVLDDPFNSQDSFRKDQTIKHIKKCGESYCQVIVLSHDQNFLKRLWDRLASCSSERKCLKLDRVGVRDTQIIDWGIVEATQSSFMLKLNALKDYYSANDGSPDSIIQQIRPVLETRMRNVSPGEFNSDELGTIIGKIRRAGESHRWYYLLDDLDSLNEYTRRYHHGDGTRATTDQIDPTELQGFVKMTLEIVGGS